MNSDQVQVQIQPAEKLAYNSKEAAAALGQSEQTIYRLIKRGHLKACSVLRHKVIPRAELERFLRDSIKGVA